MEAYIPAKKHRSSPNLGLKIEHFGAAISTIKIKIIMIAGIINPQPTSV